MLWRRYADPLGALQGYTFKDTAQFILYICSQEAEDKLWNMWLNFKPTKKQGKDKERYINFAEFKAQQGMPKRKKVEVVSKEEEAERLKFASQFIKPREENARDGN